MCMFPESSGTKFWSYSFYFQNSDIFRPELNKWGTQWKRILAFFKYKNEYHKQGSKSRWKNGVICLVSFFSSKVMVLKLPKIVFFFCKFVLASTRNLNLLKQFIYIHLNNLIMLFLKIVRFIGVWATAHEILQNKISKKMSHLVEN